jgi:hypothetical protein
MNTMSKAVVAAMTDDNEIRSADNGIPRTQAAHAPLIEVDLRSAEAPKKSSALDAHARARPVPHLTMERIVEALRASGGSIAASARQLGVARQSLYSRMLVEPAIREAREEIREEALDIAESELLKAVKRGESWAVTFFLRAMGKHRGYGRDAAPVERQAEQETQPGEFDLSRLTITELEQLESIMTKAESDPS